MKSCTTFTREPIVSLAKRGDSLAGEMLKWTTEEQVGGQSIAL
jgi:hypothetical protein